jgi:D-alanine-D-alanine ligase
MAERKYQNVGVLMGGPSAEREVSLNSGKAVARGLQKAGYDVTSIDLTGYEVDLPAGIQAVFVALHGEFGEDGRVQQILQDGSVPYTGSGPDASRRSFDKSLSKQIFREHDLPVPRYEIISNAGARTIPLPAVTKPLRQGSSIGVNIVSDEAAWEKAFADSLSYDGEVIVEEFVQGSEITVGVVGDQVLPVVEIRPLAGHYSYEAKYTKGKTDYVVPAEIPGEWAATCQDLGLRAFQALGCRGMGRVDFRMRPDGEFLILELNNIPGFTETSLLPKAAQAMGIEFPELCDRIMNMARLE